LIAKRQQNTQHEIFERLKLLIEKENDSEKNYNQKVKEMIFNITKKQNTSFLNIVTREDIIKDTINEIVNELDKYDDQKRQDSIKSHIREVRVFRVTNKYNKRIEIYAYDINEPFIYYYDPMARDKGKRLYKLDTLSDNDKNINKEFINYTDRFEQPKKYTPPTKD